MLTQVTKNGSEETRREKEQETLSPFMHFNDLQYIIERNHVIWQGVTLGVLTIMYVLSNLLSDMMNLFSNSTLIWQS